MNCGYRSLEDYGSFEMCTVCGDEHKKTPQKKKR